MDFYETVVVILADIDEKIHGEIKQFVPGGLIASFESIDFLESRKDVVLVLYHPTMGQLLHQAKVKNIYNKWVWFTKLDIIKKVQIRHETRVPFRVSLFINKIYIDNFDPFVLKKQLFMQTIDLSANGIKLYTDIKLPLNLQLALEIPLDDEAIPGIAKIIRVEEKDDGYEYGCKLIMPDYNQDKVRKYVFKLQIEERKRKRKYNLLNIKPLYRG